MYIIFVVGMFFVFLFFNINYFYVCKDVFFISRWMFYGVKCGFVVVFFFVDESLFKVVDVLWVFYGLVFIYWFLFNYFVNLKYV